MRVEVKHHIDMWQEIKDATMTTISKETGLYPTSSWKTKLIRSEHSPIRIGKIIVKCYGVKSWVATHITRHHIGIEKFVSTQRTDRTGANRDEARQDALVDMTLEMNFQAMISISRKRLCTGASKETRELWQAVVDAVRTVEPELAELCVRECEYRGGCTEFFDCGYYTNLMKDSNDVKVFRDGKVKTRNGIHFGTETTNGYMKVNIGGKNRYVHRLVAEIYIPNPENKPFVNHKNGNKKDNRVENLEWVTNAENIKHSFEELGRSNTVVDKWYYSKVPVENYAFKNCCEKYGWNYNDFEKKDSGERSSNGSIKYFFTLKSIIKEVI